MAVVLIVLYALPLVFIFIYSLAQLHLVIHYIRYHLKGGDGDSCPAVREEDLPFVTVQLPVFNEMYVVERLIDSIARFDYPKNKFEIQVLDDSTDETVEISRRKVAEWRQKGIDIHLVTRRERTGFKAGALAEGMKTARGEFIAIFDADFLPRPDFLSSTLPYFLDDPGIGAVQTRWEHLNKNYSFLTRVQAFALDAHFTVEQRGRNAGGYFMNFNGTAGVWRRTCIDDAGGWEADTLTEDLDLSYRAQLKGWRFKYLEDVGSPAELPMVMNAVKSQQFRWTKGGAETGKKNIGRIWKSGIGWGQKFHGTVHLLSNMVFVFVLLCSLLSIPVLFVKNLPGYSKYFLMMSVFIVSLIILGIFYYCSIYRRFRNPFRAFIHLVVIFPAFLCMSMGIALHNAVAALEGWLGFKSPFIRTPKFNLTSRDKTWKTNKYLKRGISLLTVFEGVLSLYFLSGIGLAFYLNDYGLLPFHVMLTAGFGLVFFYSLKHALKLKM